MQQDSHCIVGKVASPGASPTSVLEEEDVMASLSWDSRASSSQHGSPLRSSGSETSNEAPNRAKSVPKSLVETLQTCLTALPQSSATATSILSGASENRRSATSPPQARNNTATGCSKPVGAKTKRKPRASRRVPTTVLEASSTDFRDMVQKLTGIPAAGSEPKGDPLSVQVLRPQPKRAAPGMTSTTLDRPEALPIPSIPSQYLNTPQFPGASNAPEPQSFSFLEQLQQSAASSQGSPFPYLSCKVEGRELDSISTSSPFGSVGMTAAETIPLWFSGRSTGLATPVSSMPSWAGIAPESSMEYSTSRLYQETVGMADVSKQFSGTQGTQTGQTSQEDFVDSWLHMEQSSEMRV